MRRDSLGAGNTVLTSYFDCSASEPDHPGASSTQL